MTGLVCMMPRYALTRLYITVSGLLKHFHALYVPLDIILVLRKPVNHKHCFSYVM